MPRKGPINTRLTPIMNDEKQWGVLVGKMKSGEEKATMHEGWYGNCQGEKIATDLFSFLERIVHIYWGTEEDHYIHKQLHGSEEIFDGER